jgi:hypothetical protein
MTETEIKDIIGTRFEVSTAVMKKINVFWGMMLCWLMIITSAVEELDAFNFCIQAA